MQGGEYCKSTAWLKPYEIISFKFISVQEGYFDKLVPLGVTMNFSQTHKGGLILVFSTLKDFFWISYHGYHQFDINWVLPYLGLAKGDSWSFCEMTSVKTGKGDNESFSSSEDRNFFLSKNNLLLLNSIAGNFIVFPWCVTHEIKRTSQNLIVNKSSND